jgi:hypothetical protein
MFDMGQQPLLKRHNEQEVSLILLQRRVIIAKIIRRVLKIILMLVYIKSLNVSSGFSCEHFRSSAATASNEADIELYWCPQERLVKKEVQRDVKCPTYRPTSVSN